MKSAIYLDGRKFIETKFKTEEEFNRIIRDNSRILFGEKAIFSDLKNKIDSRALGSSIPDGFLFDFNDEKNPEFYLVEVELEKHDFFRHIFPQITRFFAFFRNTVSRNNLIDKLFQLVKSNPSLEAEFRKHLGRRELYKAIKDIIENSQNILLIIDDNKPELQDILETYTDTWDKMVKVEILKQYTANGKSIFTMNPDFEEIGFIKPPTQETEGEERYTESFHLQDVEKKIVSVYEYIKNGMNKLDSSIRINPQKHYISLRKNRNFAYIQFRKSKMHIVVMLSHEDGASLIQKHMLKQLSESIQKFYNGPCFQVTIENEKDLDEIVRVLEEAYKLQR